MRNLFSDVIQFVMADVHIGTLHEIVGDHSAFPQIIWNFYLNFKINESFATAP
jgi:hypothetical protein